MPKREDDLKENLELYKYAMDSWNDNLREGDVDMRYVAGDPWDEKDRKARTDAGRPCMCFDELSQYINQRINDIRMNQRAIKIDPAGNGSNETLAELRADIIRTIESKGGYYAYTLGFENMLQRGIGGWAIGKRYVSWDGFDMELYIRPIPNARSLIVDPDAKEAAASDMNYAFLLDTMPKKLFAQKFPKAEVKDFTAEVAAGAPVWFTEQNIQIAECWRANNKRVQIYLVPGVTDEGFMDANDPVTIYADDIPDGYELSEGGISYMGMTIPILREREADRRVIVQQIMNGCEILEETEWEGRWIPIVACFGRQYWIESGGGSKRIIESVIRKARDAQMLHNYIKTAEMEAIGQVIKAPYIGFEGQFEGHEDEWSYANRAPLPYLQVKPILDATGTAILPLPQRNQGEVAVQGYEFADEGVKRSIQSALGMYNASIGKHDTQARSGVAIKRLDEQSDQGSYHFVDNFDHAIEQTGRILDEMIPHVYDTQRELLVRHPDKTAEVVTINSDAFTNKKGQMVEYRTDKGTYAVTVTTGPAYQSQREMGEKTADLLLESPLGPRIADLAIRLKNLGPIGDQIADRLTPPDVAAQDNESIQGLQMKLKMMSEQHQLLTDSLNKLVQERESRILEINSKEKIAAMQAEVDKLRIQSDRERTHYQLKTKEDIALMKGQLDEEMELLKARIAEVAAEREVGGEAAKQTVRGAGRPRENPIREHEQSTPTGDIL